MLLFSVKVNSIHFTLYSEQDPTWLLQDATFEKMGALMSENSGRLIGLYDELSSLLTIKD